MITDLLRLCDEARYLPDGPKDASARLHVAVAADPARAREILAGLQGCPRTVQRHREYLQRALREIAQ